MNINILKVGYLKTNCYIVERNNSILIVDPGDDIELIKEKIKDKNIEGILITHYHFDHVGALDELKKQFNCPVYDYHTLDGTIIELNNFKFKVLHTPGHTSDSVTFDFFEQKVMFVGDFIFKDSIGRTDLETGNMDIMKMSIDRIKKHNDTKIYPGHGPETTLDYEKDNNIYFI